MGFRKGLRGVIIWWLMGWDGIWTVQYDAETVE